MRYGVVVSQELLEAVVKHPGLKELNISFMDLSSVEPRMLESVINKMEKLNLSNVKLTAQQVTNLCQVFPQEKSQLKSLNLTGIDMSGVQPELLARIVNNTEKVVLWDTKLTTQQETVFCHEMKEKFQHNVPTALIC